jgi:hypothetical protein
MIQEPSAALVPTLLVRGLDPRQLHGGYEPDRNRYSGETGETRVLEAKAIGMTV